MEHKIEAVNIFSDSSENCHGWLHVLQQEKVPYRCHTDLSSRITIFPDEFPKEGYEYVRKGGIAILEKPGELDKLGLKPRGEAVISRFYFPLDGDNVIYAPSLVDIYRGQGYGHFIVHEERLIKYGIKLGYHPLVLEVPWGKGFFFIFAAKISRLLLYHGNTLRRFSNFTDVTERVSSIDKSKVSRVLVTILKKAFEKAEIPYVGLWYYPNDYDTVFMFRIDVDGVEGETTKRISDICEKYGVRTTFYVNKDLCQAEENYLKGISDYHYVGNHGDIHNIFDTKNENKDNIISCENWLNKVFGVRKTKLFTAPRGLWNEELAVALDELGYTSSSDFGFFFDGFPFHPVVNGRPLKLLQIPTNPYCVNRARKFYQENSLGEVAPDTTIEYFKKVIKHKRSINEPILIYGHPDGLGHVSNIVLPAVFEYVRQEGIYITSIHEFSDWWLKRESVDLEVLYDGENTYKVKVPEDTDVSVMVDTKRPVKVNINSRCIILRGMKIITKS